MLLLLVVAVVAYGAYGLWNQTRPTNQAGRALRAGTLAVTAGALTLPWLWWSGLPEAAVVIGTIVVAVSQRRHNRPAPSAG